MATHHAVVSGVNPWDRCTLGGMTIAEAAASHHQLIHRIIILLQHIRPTIQKVIPQSVQFGEVNPQVSDSQKVCT